MRLEFEAWHAEVIVGLEQLYRFARVAAIIGIQCEPYGVWHVIGVGVQGLIIERMTVNRLMVGIGHRRVVGTESLIPCLSVILRAVEQIAKLTAVEAEFGDLCLGTGYIFGTTLLVGTQGSSVSKEEAGSNIVSYVAHDIAIVLLSVVISYDSVLVAVAAFDTRMVSHLAHQAAHDNSRGVMEVYLAALNKAVAQHAVARQLSCQASHTVYGALSRECAVLDTKILHGTDDIVEESHRLTLVVAHRQVLDDIATTVVVTFESCGTGSDGDYQ